MKRISLLISLLFFYLLPSPILAQFGPIGFNGCSSTQVSSAIGCIEVGSVAAFTGWFLGWGIGISGGIALLFVLYSIFLITTSAGDPKKLQAGQEQLTSSITGLLMVIFSVFLLKVVGYDVFRLPGFNP